MPGRPLVVQEERRHQIAFVERLEHVDGVEHAALVRVCQLLDECFDTRPVGNRRAPIEAHVVGLHVPLLDAAAEGRHVLALGADRHDEPDRHQHEAGIRELRPVDAEAPRLDQDEQDNRAEAPCHAIDRHVDERLRACFHVDRERKIEHLAGRSVDVVAERLIERPAKRRRARGRETQNDPATQRQAHREDEQREADPEIPMDAARQADLEDNPINDMRTRTLAKYVVIASNPRSSIARLSCWLRIMAPRPAKPISRAISCTCLELASSRRASRPPTPSSAFAALRDCPADFRAGRSRSRGGRRRRGPRRC